MNAMKTTNKAILLLEEDKELAASIQMFLEDSYRVYAIHDASQLVQYISRYNIDMIITELDFPHPAASSSSKPNSSKRFFMVSPQEF